MADQPMRGGPWWRRIEEDGAEWEVRTVPGPRQIDPAQPGEPGEEELLEFVCLDGSRKPRRVAVEPGSLPEMTGAELRRAYVQARPIGGDHYGRPGKPPNDAV